ncbi:Uncharacterised protein [Vibrio cholerae]|nr:Uncharacterised protein [Vibrio cholerae]
MGGVDQALCTLFQTAAQLVKSHSTLVLSYPQDCYHSVLSIGDDQFLNVFHSGFARSARACYRACHLALYAHGRKAS